MDVAQRPSWLTLLALTVTATGWAYEYHRRILEEARRLRTLARVQEDFVRVSAQNSELSNEVLRVRRGRIAGPSCIEKVLGDLEAVTDEARALLNSDMSHAELDGAVRCAVCLENPRGAILYPCKHAQFCFPCAKRLWDRDMSCPVCRSLVVNYEEIYI